MLLSWRTFLAGCHRMAGRGRRCALITIIGPDRIVGEVNNGGDLIENVLRTVDPQVSYRSVHASRGKYLRAEPIAALYEQGRVHHVGMFAELEDQLCSFVPNEFNGSPDRLDAAVWALTELFLEPEEIRGVLIYEDRTSISPF